MTTRQLSATDLWQMARVGQPEPHRDGSFAIVPVTSYDLASNKGVTRLWTVASDGTRKALTSQTVSSNSLQATPIVALTAGIGNEDKDRCTEAGMDAYLTKPFSISELSQSIQQFEEQIANRKTMETNSKLVTKIEQIEETTSSQADINPEIFNIRAINNIREIEQQTGKILLPSILDGFTNQMQEKLTEISNDLRSGDPDKLYRTAHAIKSMSANIGAEKVRSISAEVEGIGRSGNIATVGTSLLEISEAYEEFVREFRVRFM